MSMLSLIKSGVNVMIRDEFWDIEVDKYEYPGIDPEMKEHVKHLYEVIAIDSRTQTALLADEYWYHFSWITPMVSEDTLFELYVNGQMDENEYEYAKEVINNA